MPNSADGHGSARFGEEEDTTMGHTRERKRMSKRPCELSERAWRGRMWSAWQSSERHDGTVGRRKTMAMLLSRRPGRQSASGEEEREVVGPIRAGLGWAIRKRMAHSRVGRELVEKSAAYLVK